MSSSVDIRDVRELEREGMIPGALHAPRGMLEFWWTRIVLITRKFLVLEGNLFFTATPESTFWLERR